MIEFLTADMLLNWVWKKLCEIWLTNQTQTEEAGLNLWRPFALNGLSFKNLFQRTFRPLSSLSMNVKNDWQNLAQTDWNYETFLLIKSIKNLFQKTFRPLSSLSMNVKNEYMNFNSVNWGMPVIEIMKPFC